MAKSIETAERGDQPTEATRLHNVKDRRVILQTSAADIRKLEAEAEALRAKVKGINKHIADTFRKVKSDLGITRKNFERMIALASLETDERNETIDQLRECYAALAPGETLDWIDSAAKKPHGTKPTSEAAATLQ